jgi:hypothetical protein
MYKKELKNIQTEISDSNQRIKTISSKHEDIFHAYKQAMNELNTEIKILRNLKSQENKILTSIRKQLKRDSFSKKLDDLNMFDWSKMLNSESEDNLKLLKNILKNSAIQHSGIIAHTLQNSVKLCIHKNTSNAEILFVETVINKIKEHFIPFERGRYETKVFIEFFAKVYRSEGDSYSLIFSDNSWRILYRDDSISEPFKSLNHALKMFRTTA